MAKLCDLNVGDYIWLPIKNKLVRITMIETMSPHIIIRRKELGFSDLIAVIYFESGWLNVYSENAIIKRANIKYKPTNKVNRLHAFLKKIFK